MRPKPLAMPGPFPRFDERDTVFARARLRPGEERYQAYYQRHPERQAGDDRTRRLRGLASPGGRRFRPLEAALIKAQFSASDLVAAALERDEAGHPSGLGPGPAGEGSAQAAHGPELTARIKRAARFLGADDAGVTALDPGLVYSHRGVPLARHGRPVALEHELAVVLVFAMRSAYIASGPELAATAETARVYQQLGAASFALASLLRRLGFEARAHVDANYLVICPPLAVRAGLGELGRNGVLVHHRLGPAVRLGVVTTSAPLRADRPGCWGIADFCRSCEKCAEHCPSGSVACGQPVMAGGGQRWPLRPERCYHYWRSQGSDCGICLRVCPFFKPNTPLHDLVRRVVARTTRFNRLFVRLDDRFYGAEPRSSPLDP